MLYLRQSTASQEVPLGYFVDSTDGNTEETGLTIANTDIKIWKTGATSLANKNSGGGTHISNGIYYAVLDATDTDTIGPMVIFCHVSGALTVRLECCVLDEAVYDVLFGTTALATLSNITAAAGITLADGAITAAKIAADAITAAKIADGAIDAGSIAVDAITSAKIADGAITAAKIADGAIDRATFAADTGLQSIRSNTAQAGAASTITLDASASATNDIYNDCLIYLTGGTGAGQAAWITDYVGATKVATTKPAWITTPDNTTTFAIIPAASVWHQILADHVVSGSTGAGLNSASSAGDPWNTSLPGAYGAGTAGKILGDNLNATVSSRASQTSLDTVDDFLDTEIAAIKAKTDNLPSDPADQSAVEAAISAVWTATMTESYAADTAAMTPVQALHMIWSCVAQFAVASTTITCKKLDGSTTSMTFDLDSATSPTSRNRAS